MSIIHTVAQGDCVRSLSKKYGLAPDTIWQHANNADLRKLREDPQILFEGDQVFIPEKELGTLSGGTGQTHKFRLRTGSTLLKLRLLVDEEPLSGAQYVLTIDRTRFEGSTDDDGRIEQIIAPDAERGVLLLEDMEQIELKLGVLDPLDTTSGVRQRLASLAYSCGQNKTECNVVLWQQDHDLSADGRVDARTKASLKSEYGC